MSSERRDPEGSDFIPLCVPEIRGNEWRYVKECLDGNWVSTVGPFVDRFERRVAEYLGARSAVATASGTAALHVALLAAGIGPGEEVLVSTLTFIAPVNAIRYVGAWPVFIDAEPLAWQMDPAKVVDFLERECRWAEGKLRNRSTGRTVTAVLPVHILGHPVDMDPILAVARKYHLTVIEDAGECLGSRYGERMVGRLGDMGCLSFNGNKIMTTGGGGMITTDLEAAARRAKHLTTQAKTDPVEYIHDEIGYNYRLTNVQAAMGCAQLEKLDEYVAAKRRIAAKYEAVLADLPGVRPMREAPGAFSTKWLYTVMVNEQEAGVDSRTLIRVLAEANIQARPLWQPLHLSKPHKNCPSYHGAVAERLYREGISLPCSVGLTAGDQDRVIAAFRAAFSGGRRRHDPS